ncbi:hypothetical protein LP419_26465 [Massilia sp. H-1]|nr:hypothetical protein LP419_26465 [Massilia sp. H-1]
MCGTGHAGMGVRPAVAARRLSTIIFLLALPTLWKDWWRTSRYTRLFTLTGASGTQQVVFSFHRDGHYHLQLRWSDGSGPLMLGEPGTYAGDCRTSLLLTSHDGRAPDRQRSQRPRGQRCGRSGPCAAQWLAFVRLRPEAALRCAASSAPSPASGLLFPRSRQAPCRRSCRRWLA